MVSSVRAKATRTKGGDSAHDSGMAHGRREAAGIGTYTVLIDYHGYAQPPMRTECFGQVRRDAFEALASEQADMDHGPGWTNHANHHSVGIAFNGSFSSVLGSPSSLELFVQFVDPELSCILAEVDREAGQGLPGLCALHS